MILVLITFLLINLLFIISFALGEFFIFKIQGNPNMTASYALYLGVLFVFYFFAILAVVTAGLLVEDYLALWMLIFIALPFIIGEKATYEKLNLYSMLQLLVLLLSFIFGIYLLVF